jgi:predicted ABC-type ATPase
VLEGGHNVAAQRILARYPRTIALLAQAVRLADAALLHDSFDAQPGTHKLVATCQGQTTRILHQPLPHWAHTVLQLSH